MCEKIVDRRRNNFRTLASHAGGGPIIGMLFVIVIGHREEVAIANAVSQQHKLHDPAELQPKGCRL